MAMVAGVLYGLNFTPIIYIQDNYKGASQDGQSHTHTRTHTHSHPPPPHTHTHTHTHSGRVCDADSQHQGDMIMHSPCFSDIVIWWLTR